ncbi:MAG: DUF1127 domain-containing protein [Defluviimonas sp.]|uniref:DUF1127 domain-containing protein n=1 Tax=Albidovulum sp. TaxID=1872424 RepID=UPI001DBAD691|nr:DUF1127 domain-containing protein [Paracoccaceae bacterium]MCC0064164.1 DUF1127 domain-containing protein [Defluviimonas sp.]
MTRLTPQTLPLPLALADRLGSVVHRVAEQVTTAHQAARSRRALARLEPHRLDDIGVSESARARELARPFWNV